MTTGVRSSKPIATDVIADCEGCDWQFLSHEAAPSTVAEGARWHAFKTRHTVRISRTTVRKLRRCS